MGVISKLFAWTSHPSIDTERDPKDWIYGLIFVLVLSFLWSRVVREIVEA